MIRLTCNIAEPIGVKVDETRELDDVQRDVAPEHVLDSLASHARRRREA